METKMKGLLKGLRYISQIFDNQEEKEPEMQIGFPTDVKHVAHIGCDGTSANSSPGWMNDYRSAPHFDHGNRGGSAADSPRNQLNSSDSHLQDVDSSSREASSNRQSRRNQSSSAVSYASEGSKQERRIRSTAGVAGVDQSGADPTAVPKQPRRRKAKGTASGEVSTKSSSGAKKADRPASESGAE